MEENWFKYLSDQNDENIVPLMESFFNDKLTVNELSDEAEELGYRSFHMFQKDVKINELLGD